MMPPVIDTNQIDANPVCHTTEGKGKSEPPLEVSTTRLVNTVLIGPQHTNELGICSGEHVLSWIDVAAGMASSRVARTDCVTASVDAVHILEPCHPGDILIISVMVNRTFRTSMEVGVRVEAETLHTGKKRYCCSAYLTFVALGENGKGIPVRQVKPMSPDQQRRYVEAGFRRERRLRDKETYIFPPLALQSATIDVHQPFNKSMSMSIVMEETNTYMARKVFPQHANSLGVTFGGKIMAWMQEIGYVSASRYGRNGTMVLASVDSLAFHHPTKIGDIVHTAARVTASFKHSVEVYVSVYRASKETGYEVQHCNSGLMTFVALDRDTLQPVSVPI
eukprot:Ihof_evm1s538 gene=Ihof_evmTU1s538